MATRRRPQNRIIFQCDAAQRRIYDELGRILGFVDVNGKVQLSSVIRFALRESAIAAGIDVVSIENEYPFPVPEQDDRDDESSQ